MRHVVTHSLYFEVLRRPVVVGDWVIPKERNSDLFDTLIVGIVRRIIQGTRGEIELFHDGNSISLLLQDVHVVEPMVYSLPSRIEE